MPKCKHMNRQTHIGGYCRAREFANAPKWVYEAGNTWFISCVDCGRILKANFEVPFQDLPFAPWEAQKVETMLEMDKDRRGIYAGEFIRPKCLTVEVHSATVRFALDTFIKYSKKVV